MLQVMSKKNVVMLLFALYFLCGCGSSTSKKSYPDDVAGVLLYEMERDIAEYVAHRKKLSHLLTEYDSSFNAAVFYEKLQKVLGVNHRLVKARSNVEQGIELTISNISNVNTVAYKKQRLQVLEGHTPRIVRDWGQGNFEQTERETDLLIEGDGFFMLLKEDGEPVFTRAGSFKVGADNHLVSHDDLKLEPPVLVPKNTVKIEIDRTGYIVFSIGKELEKSYAQLFLYTFRNRDGLGETANGRYHETGQSGSAVEFMPGRNGGATIFQGFIEGSNVDIVEEAYSLKSYYSILNEIDSALSKILTQQ